VIWAINAYVGDSQFVLAGLVHSLSAWTLACVPALYWPMAVATASLLKRYQDVWHVDAGLRAICQAPLEYTSIVAAGIATFATSWLVFRGLGQLLGLPSMFWTALLGVPLGIAHAVMGALTGQLLRSKPELFG
jgi:hypothetical protein